MRHVIHGWDCPNIGPKPLENALRTTPYLNPKGQGDKSMEVTQRLSEGCLWYRSASSARYG